MLDRRHRLSWNDPSACSMCRTTRPGVVVDRAVAAAHRTNCGEAWPRLDAVERLAGLLGEDANDAWTAFGLTNVGIHRVTIAAGVGDPGDALRSAPDVDPRTV